MIDKLNKLCNEALDIKEEKTEDLILVGSVSYIKSKIYNKLPDECNVEEYYDNVSGPNNKDGLKITCPKSKTWNVIKLAKQYGIKCVFAEAINEKWDKMEGSSLFGDAFFTDRLDDVIFKLKSIPEMGYKLLCDEKKGFYMLCNAEDNIHNDMLKSAVSMGFYYPEMTKDWEVEDYIYCSTYNDENYLIYLTIKPDDKDPGDQMCDGYYCQYIYKDFVLYPRDCDYEETKFYRAIKDKLIKVNPLEG